MKLYDIEAKTIDGKETSLSEYKGKVLLIVNTASKCGFTPQFEGLEALYQKYADKDFEILGFPCNQFKHQDPESNENIKSFCQLNYGVTFPLFEKVDVRGENIHPVFDHLVSQAPFAGWDDSDPTQKKLHNLNKTHYPEFAEDESIKWNFTKFLVDKEGNVVKRFDSWIEPKEIEADIEALL